MLVLQCIRSTINCINYYHELLINITIIIINIIITLITTEFRKVFNSLGNKTSLDASKLGEALTALGYQYTEEELTALCQNGDITSE